MNFNILKTVHGKHRFLSSSEDWGRLGGLLPLSWPFWSRHVCSNCKPPFVAFVLFLIASLVIPRVLNWKNMYLLPFGWKKYQAKPLDKILVISDGHPRHLYGISPWGYVQALQAPVVQRLDNAIQRIRVNKTNHAIHRIVISPADSVIHFLNNRDLYFFF